jgi:hypothetical protein
MPGSCTSAARPRICPRSRRQFQNFVTICVRSPGPPRQLVLVPQQGPGQVVRRSHACTALRMGEKLYSSRYNVCKYEGMNYHVEEWCVSSTGSCHEVHATVSGAPKHDKLHRYFPFWTGSQPFCTPEHFQENYHNIVTWMVRALLGNWPLNTSRPNTRKATVGWRRLLCGRRRNRCYATSP